MFPFDDVIMEVSEQNRYKYHNEICSDYLKVRAGISINALQTGISQSLAYHTQRASPFCSFIFCIINPQTVYIHIRDPASYQKLYIIPSYLQEIWARLGKITYNVFTFRYQRDYYIDIYQRLSFNTRCSALCALNAQFKYQIRNPVEWYNRLFTRRPIACRKSKLLKWISVKNVDGGYKRLSYTCIFGFQIADNRVKKCCKMV